MYNTVEHLDQACGILLLNDVNTFIYCCRKCPNEFSSGPHLETHILFEHQDERKNVENVFINEYDFGAPTTEPASLPENKIYSTEDQENKLEVRQTAKREVEDSIESTVKVKPISWLPANSDDSGSSEPMSPVESLNQSGMSDDSSIEDSADAVNSNINKKKRGRPPGVKTKTTKTQTSKVFHCDMCPKITLSTLEIVRQHMKRHILNKVRKQCSICGITPRNYEKHMKMTHLEARPYKCDYCDSTYTSNKSRVIHLCTHTGDRPFLCASCGKSFKSSDARHKHNLRMHSDKLPHPCLECGRTFINPSSLQEHIYSFHSDVRPYTCDVCGNRFKTRKYLRKHKQSHGEKIHSCRYCEKKFKTTETRRWHERTVHKAV